MTEHDPYFTSMDENATFTVPDTISDIEIKSEQDYQYLPQEAERTHRIKWLFISIVSLMASMLVWEVYTTLVALAKFNVLFYLFFILLLLVISVLGSIEIYRFYKGQQQLKRVDEMRDQADKLIRERSHGKSSLFITELKQLYSESAQGRLLQQVISKQPDYLNDAEIITYLSEHFFAQLDKEAQQLITSESIKIGSLIALSPLAIVDTLVVFWRTMKMVNQINIIYGLQLTRIGQWQVLLKIVKAMLLAAGTEIAISSIVDKTTTGLTGVVAGSIAQGLGVAIYVAKVGVEGMKQSRPVIFSKNEQPDMNLIMSGIRLGFMNITSKQNN